MVRALEMVAPGTALREGIDNIQSARSGGLIVIGDADELAFLFSGGIKLDLDYSPTFLYELGEDGRRDRPQLERDQDRARQRPADSGSDDPHAGDRHPAPDRRARVQADRRAGGRDLRAPRGGLAVRRRDQVHPRGHPGRAGQGQPGAGHARQVPQPARPGLDASDRPGVRGRGDVARRADGLAARRARDPDGGRDRALHRRARNRGPADRDAARRDDGGRLGRQGGARPRLPGRGRRPRVRDGVRPAGAPPASGPAWTSVAWRSCWATTAS